MGLFITPNFVKGKIITDATIVRTLFNTVVHCNTQVLKHCVACHFLSSWWFRVSKPEPCCNILSGSNALGLLNVKGSKEQTSHCFPAANAAKEESFHLFFDVP
jgi:hypothetical protein